MSDPNIDLALARIVGRTNLIDDLIQVDIFEEYYKDDN